MTDSLDKLRARIDELDAELVKRLNERLEIASAIGEQKKKDQGEIYVPAREKQVFERVASYNKGPMKAQSLQAIYREIMSASLALEHDIVVTYLGPPSTFTHQAARSKFGDSVTYRPCMNISDVFQAVVNKTCDYGVVPIENSTEGAVTHTLDEFPTTSAKICAEMYMSIEHHLFSRSPLKDIQTVYSNPNALGQCRQWLNQNLHAAEQISVPSTTQAAERAAREDGAAAVCSQLVSEEYDLPVQAENIQDIMGNRTRFLVIGRQFSDLTGEDKTAIVFSIHHRIGALQKALKVFSDHKLNMTKIESRPSKQRDWEYFFFVDLEGHIEDDPIRRALEELETHCTLLKVLGAFPRAVELEEDEEPDR